MLEKATNSELLSAWKEGNQAAATVLFRRYMARVTAFARAHLSRRLARRCDPEDIALSAWRSFFVEMEKTQAPQPDDLWPLLATITFRKLSAQAARHQAAKRSIDQEMRLEEWSSLLADDPPPEHATMIADEVLWVMGQLAPLQREILSLTLRGRTAAEIADELDCTERTVRRGREQVHELLSHKEHYGEPITRRHDGEIQDALPVAKEVPEKPARRRPRFQLSTQTLKFFTDNDILLQRYVGSGAFSRVYQSLKRDDGTTIAVKFLRKHLWREPRTLGTLKREIRIAEQLQHSHLVRCEGWGLSRNQALFLVLQWVDGTQIGQWVAETHPDPREIVQKLLPILDVLQSANGCGIMHCDLTPANILIDRTGKPLLADLGLASFTKEPRKSGGGTPGFLAPEQISDAFGQIDQRTDVYGVGGLLHALLTGAPPHTGRDIPEVLANVLSANPVPPLRTDGRPIPSRLSEVITQCLCKEPKDRPASVAEVRRMLETCLTEEV